MRTKRVECGLNDAQAYSIVHLHWKAHIGYYIFRIGTDLDEIAPIGLSALFSAAFEILGHKDTNPIGLSGISRFSPSDNFGVLTFRDENVQFFLLFEGAGTDQIPTFRDPFLRGACLALFKTFQQNAPLDCGGIYHSEGDTLSENVVHSEFQSIPLPLKRSMEPPHLRDSGDEFDKAMFE